MSELEFCFLLINIYFCLVYKVLRSQTPNNPKRCIKDNCSPHNDTKQCDPNLYIIHTKSGVVLGSIYQDIEANRFLILFGKQHNLLILNYLHLDYFFLIKTNLRVRKRGLNIDRWFFFK